MSGWDYHVVLSAFYSVKIRTFWHQALNYVIPSESANESLGGMVLHPILLVVSLGCCFGRGGEVVRSKAD
jgi:hypothetical protein